MRVVLEQAANFKWHHLCTYGYNRCFLKIYLHGYWIGRSSGLRCSFIPLNSSTRIFLFRTIYMLLEIFGSIERSLILNVYQYYCICFTHPYLLLLYIDIRFRYLGCCNCYCFSLFYTPRVDAGFLENEQVLWKNGTTFWSGHILEPKNVT